MIPVGVVAVAFLVVFLLDWKIRHELERGK